jgi:hypothetical protein
MTAVAAAVALAVGVPQLSAPSVYGPPPPSKSWRVSDAPGKFPHYVKALSVDPPISDARGIFPHLKAQSRAEENIIAPKTIMTPERKQKSKQAVIQQRGPTPSECAQMISGVNMIGRGGVKVTALARGYSDAQVEWALRGCGL